MIKEIEWDICGESEKKNFKCSINNSGLWRLENPPINGKWVFCIDKIGNLNAPTHADQKNFFTGLIEAEKRNDEFIFNDGNPRNPQTKLKAEMYRDFLDSDTFTNNNNQKGGKR